MEELKTIGLVLLALIVTIGVIRTIFTPYTGFWDCLMHIFLIDFLFDFLGAIIEGIADMWS
jgi:hypothetical protein